MTAPLSWRPSVAAVRRAAPALLLSSVVTFGTAGSALAQSFGQGPGFPDQDRFGRATPAAGATAHRAGKRAHWRRPADPR